MKINIISVGKLDKIHNSIADSYRKMIGWKLSETEITYSKKVGSDIIKKFEADLIRDKLSSNANLVVLDERGDHHTSHEFSKMFERSMMQGIDIDFVIGGAYGLDPAIIESAKIHLSFSKMTLPHQMVKIILLEQIYRADTIIKGHPYHK